MIKLIFVLLLIGNICYAEDSIYLNKSQAAPYAGYLLPEAEVQSLRNNTIERDGLKTINANLTQQLTLEQQDSALKDQKVNLLLQQNDALAKTAYADRSLNTWEKIGYFAAGILITGLAVYGAHELYH